MKAIGWLLVMIGIGSIIEGYHGKAIWTTLNDYLLKGGQAQTTSTGPKQGQTLD